MATPSGVAVTRAPDARSPTGRENKGTGVEGSYGRGVVVKGALPTGILYGTRKSRSRIGS